MAGPGNVRARLAVAMLTGAALASALGAGVAQAKPPEGGSSAGQFAEIRRATAKYHDLDVALADGYIPFGEAHCIANPGVGAMGSHYYNPQLLFDGVLDPTKPELLVYAPSGNGGRLAAVEYMMPLSTWTGSGAPDLFGVPFDGPMPEHEPGTSGDHYDQHLWIWGHNPAGILATWNPSVAC